MKRLLTVSVATACLVLTACGSGEIPEVKKVHRAPTSSSETGVIVSGLAEAEMAKVLNENKNLKVRVVNKAHDLYEVFGTNAKNLRNVITAPDVIIEDNKFVSLKVLRADDPANNPAAAPAKPIQEQRHPFVAAIEDNMGVKLEGEPKKFVASCRLNNITAPKITVDVNQGRDAQNTSIFFELGQILKMDASKSKPKGTAKKLEFLWLITSPDDSALAPVASLGNQIAFTPDTTGLHIYSVIAKDDFGFCQIDLQPVYVTANYPFQPENVMPDSLSASIDPNTFWHVFHVLSQQVWAKAVGTGMVVGIIDSGVDYNHPAIASNILVNTNEIAGNGQDDDNNGFIDDVAGYDFGLDDASPFDDFGHGTHVAGIAASNIFGAARKSLILPTKFGAGLGFDVASVTGAIKYSIDRGAKVLNMSFGWDEDLAVMKAAMDYAEKKGVLIIAASGNDTANNDTTGSFPCNYNNPNIISVAASDENDNLTFYSNFGKKVHLAAPGGTPEKPIISSYKRNPKNAQFVGLMGTSMASPLIAGVAAQVWSANPDLSAVQMRNILIESGKPVASLKGKILSGKVVNAEAALQMALATRPGSSSLP
jgi:subtilisin family serine protease